MTPSEVCVEIDETGGQIAGGTPEEFARFIESETAKWADLIKSAKITVD